MSRYHSELGSSAHAAAIAGNSVVFLFFTEFEVVDLRPGSTFGWVEHGQRKGSKIFFRLDPAGEATSITVQIVWPPMSLVAWVRGRFFPKRDVQRQLSNILENLRKILLR